MPRMVMERSASDNVYLHKDFHGALSAAVQYLDEQYGEAAVREFLFDFAHRYYAPLRERIGSEGLAPLREWLEATYAREGAAPLITQTEDELVVELDACPAVSHMRAHGYQVARLFHETTSVVNEAICEGADYASELTGYDETTGAGIQRFYRRAL